MTLAGGVAVRRGRIVEALFVCVCVCVYVFAVGMRYVQADNNSRVLGFRISGGSNQIINKDNY